MWSVHLPFALVWLKYGIYPTVRGWVGSVGKEGRTGEVDRSNGLPSKLTQRVARWRLVRKPKLLT